MDGSVDGGGIDGEMVGIGRWWRKLSELVIFWISEPGHVTVM